MDESYTPNKTVYMIIYPCQNRSLTILLKGAHIKNNAPKVSVIMYIVTE